MPKLPDHSSRGHSPLPPSSSDKWFHCHGWLQTVGQHRSLYGEQSPSAAAEEGTAAHEKFEAHLRKTTPPKAKARKRGPAVYLGGPASPSTGQEIAVDDDDYEDLMECVDWVHSQSGELHLEVQVDYGEFFKFYDLTGTADVIIRDGNKKLTVADLKFGRVPVEVRSDKYGLNPQLMCYLMGAIHEFGEFEEYQITILQPRAWHRDGPIRIAKVAPRELLLFEFELERALEENFGRGTCNPGPWCMNYCEAKSTCKARIKHLREALFSSPEE